MKRYLGKLGEENLFSVALVCHGVSSPKAFSMYLKEVEIENSSSIKNIRFRDKKEEDGKLTHRFTTINLENGKELASTNNVYTTAFGIGVMDRESCYSCPYASPSGAGDITIGDFWGIERYIPEINGEISKGISLLIPHTVVGEQMVSDMERYMNENMFHHGFQKIEVKFSSLREKAPYLGAVSLVFQKVFSGELPV